MADKRRRARVQGGWAGSDSLGKKSFERGKDETQKTTQNDRSVSSFQTKLSAPTRGSHLPEGGQDFVYCASDDKELRVAPEEIYVRDNGVHEISSGPNGSSIIEFKNDFVPKSEQDWLFEQLLNEIPWKQEQIIIKGEKVNQPRLTAWFGNEQYSYSGLVLQPYRFSPTLLLLRDKVEDFTGHTFNSVLANLYRDCKDSIDWHSDDEGSLGVNPVIASLSIGETRNFELRKKVQSGSEEDYKFTQKVKIPLRSGSLVVMKGATQADWQHRVPKEYHDRSARINLTFRTIVSLSTS